MCTVKITRQDDGKKGSFTIFENDVKAGKMTYKWTGETKFIIDHTEVDKIHSGKGYGKKLIIEGANFAREKKSKVVPICSYAKKVLEKDASFEDILF